MRDISTIKAENTLVTIFSAFRPEYDGEQNVRRHNSLCDSLRAFGKSIGEAIGSYKGEAELSIILAGSGERFALEIGRAYDQESILVVDKAHAPGKRIARLIECQSGREIARGPFYATTREDALSRDAYTYVSKTDTYFVADLDFA